MSGRTRSSFSDAQLARVVPLLAALGDRTRLKLVLLLVQGGPQSLARLTGATDITRQGVAKHLSVLEEAGLVSAQWAGRERQWQVEPDRLAPLREWIDELSLQWDRALTSLKEFT